MLPLSIAAARRRVTPRAGKPAQSDGGSELPHSLRASIERFELEKGSGPHNCIEGRDGAVWFSGNTAGYIGRFDPRTGKVAKFPSGKTEKFFSVTPITPSGGATVRHKLPPP